MIDSGDGYAVHRVNKRKAQKEHRCYDCGRTITAGETYHDSWGLYEDRWDHCRICGHCEAAGQWLMRMCNGWLYGGIGEELDDHWGEGYPYRNVALGRIIVHRNRRWEGVTPEQIEAWANESVDRIERSVAA